MDVMDNGPGIPPDILPRVFDPFFTTKGAVHGVGLGLFVAEGLVRSAGGSIAARNAGGAPGTPYRGAWFHIELPAPNDAATRALATRRCPSGRRRTLTTDHAPTATMPRLLVVDDDNAFRLSTAALLRADGHEVDVAPDATAAVQALRARAYDLVLLDLRMPGIDGIQLVETLRVWGESVPVLMISGYGTVESAVRAMHLGTDDFLTKPVEPDVLSARVAELLERRPMTAGDDAAVAAGWSAAPPVMRDAVRLAAPGRAAGHDRARDRRDGNGQGARRPRRARAVAACGARRSSPSTAAR